MCGLGACPVIFSIEKERVMGKTILYLNDAAEIGGGERNLMAWIGGLKDSPWRPIVTCPREGSFSKALQKSNIQVEWVKLPDWRKSKDWGTGVKAWFKINQLVQREQVVLIHANSPPWLPIGCLVSKWNRIPCAVSVQSRLEPRRVKQFLLHHANVIFTVADCLRVFIEDSGVEKGKTKTIYSTVDTEWFLPYHVHKSIRDQFGISEEDFVIGCIANIAHYKGHDILLQAFAKIVEDIPMAHCLLVGKDDSEFATSIKALARKLGLNEKIHFAGFQNDTRPFYQAIDVMVLPSRVEGAPVALLEAMAMEKPLIASSVDGTPEIVQDGVTGILVPPEASEKVVEAILELFRNPKKSKAMGKAGRSWVNRFNSSVSQETLIGGYREVLPNE